MPLVDDVQDQLEAIYDIRCPRASDFLLTVAAGEAPISDEELRAAIRRATLALKMTPVMCGSA